MRLRTHTRATFFAGALSISSLAAAQSTSFVLSGIDDFDAYGQSVRSAGDVDADGYGDLVVGSPLAESGGTNRGRVQLISGKDRHVIRTWNGTADQERFGASVSGVGDVDGDGHDDVIVGAPGAFANGADSGKTVVYSGASGAAIYAMVGVAAGDALGKAVTGGFDANGDGIGDFAVGAPGDDVNLNGDVAPDCGSVRVYSGATGLLLAKRAAYWSNYRLGSSLAPIGDLDGDGKDEVIAGAPGGPNSAPESGSAWIFAGATGEILMWASGDVADAHLGTSVSAVRDFDADGLPDLLVGAPNDGTGGTNAGRASIYSTGTWNLLWTITGTAGDALGQSVASVGDMNGDAFADFAVGAPHAPVQLFADRGRVTLHSGLGGAQIGAFGGASTGGLFGAAVCGAGDANGDGLADVAIGAPLDDGNVANSGTVRLVLMGDAVGTEFCFGDGSGVACPCSNASALGARAGCLNSIGAGGRLVADGIAEVSSDSLTLRASGLPQTTVLLFQGTAEVNAGHGTLFGDGLRCVGGTVVRMGVHTTVFGGASWPQTSEPDLSVRGNVPQSGATRYYQAWYRNAAPFCTASTFNLTNGVLVGWQP